MLSNLIVDHCHPLWRLLYITCRHQVDVDVIMSEGSAVYGAVSDNWPTIEPYFNETGSNAPSILPKYQQKELLDLSVKSVQVRWIHLSFWFVLRPMQTRPVGKCTSRDVVTLTCVCVQQLSAMCMCVESSELSLCVCDITSVMAQQTYKEPPYQPI